MSGTAQSVGESKRPCVVCDQQTGLKIEGDAGDDTHLCRECWDDRLDEGRVLVELGGRGILTPESLFTVLETFYEYTAKTDHYTEFGGVLPDAIIPTSVRRGQPMTLAQLADVGGSNDGWDPYNALRWNVENANTEVFAVVLSYSIGGDFPTLGATLYVAETIEEILEYCDEDPFFAGTGGA